MICVDFETHAIGPRPHYPPRPVGVAIRIPGKKPKYWGFGHPTNNNCTEDRARAALGEVWQHPLLMHNAKFDYEVATHWWDLPQKKWQDLHDTMYLLYLDDPHAESFSLKPSAERYLQELPTEQDAVREWLINHKIVKRIQKNWGAHICDAPGDLVGEYAIGDVNRTAALYRLLMPRIKEHGMVAAYDRERELMLILLANEQQGIRCDVEQLGNDIDLYQASLERVERWIRKTLKVPGLNLDSDREMAEALEGHVTQWTLTETGQKSVSKVNLKPQHFVDQKLASAIGYRTRLMTCLNTFMRPWYELATNMNGRICTNWNQTRGDRGGTRTGRLSSSAPLNLQNIPKSFDDKHDGYVHPAFLKMPSLPLIRKYILPDEGCVILHRDFASQELRILAHYEDGALLKAYQENANLDPHSFIRGEIERIATLKLERRPVKITVFTSIYGGGLGKLAEQLNSTVEMAGEIKAALRKAMPDVDSLDRELKSIWRKGLPIRTWGGRLYHCEKAKDGRTFEYKALNTEIQGSAADITKQSIINYHNSKEHGRFLLSCHDENNVSVPAKHAHSEMKLLCESMESISLDVALLSDGKTGPNWGSLSKYEDQAA